MKVAAVCFSGVKILCCVLRSNLWLKKDEEYFAVAQLRKDEAEKKLKGAESKLLQLLFCTRCFV